MQDALKALVGATRASGVGLGGVSRSLLILVSGGTEPTAADAAVAHWNTLLDLPALRGD
ncbi:MAG TPA: hypothetical protein VGC05_21015 [Mycobacterium sp.]